MAAEQRDNLSRRWQQARAYAAENPEGWLVFSGPYGSGKTHLAAAIANHQAVHGTSRPMFVVVPDLLDHLRATFARPAATRWIVSFEQVERRRYWCWMTWVQRVPRHGPSEKLFQLFNYRYAARLPTVITTNQT